MSSTWRRTLDVPSRATVEEERVPHATRGVVKLKTGRVRTLIGSLELMASEPSGWKTKVDATDFTVMTRFR